MKQPYNLIQVFTRDDLKLSGLMLDGDKTKTAALFVHGFIGDFYLHKFYHLIAKNLSEKKNALILAQTRGTGLRTEFMKRDGSEIYLGSYYEKIEEAHWDISAFIKFLLEEGYLSFCLIGFSYGTIKVIRYLFEGEFKEKIAKLVLL
ncbi:hypothetical protein KKH13_01200, partial [Patescibacteria group bacterium]|nr:hypothetical protein [Patescibacteria group bacterium]